ncbi:MAG: hypothetical protein IKU26_05615 [Clostridia bacterium]|nr:hypothetical protein [Clostridia bacterium]
MNFEWKRICCLMICMLLCTGLVACGGSSSREPGASADATDESAGNMGALPSEDPNPDKPKLYFSQSGDFKVVIFSDLRVSKNVDSKVITNIETILDREKPDLVILGGDVHDGSVSNEQELRQVLDAINAPLEERQIPWCNAFGVDTEGTPDKKTGYNRKDQMEVYRSYLYCISRADTDSVYGVSNYVLPIRISSNDKVGFNVWCLDANGYLNDFEAGLEEKVLLKRDVSGGTNLDSIHFTQICWYWDTSVAMQSEYGGKIPGFMYFQVAPYQFMLVKRNKEQTGATGNLTSKASAVSASERESGIFWYCYERGDIQAIFSGYNAENDFSGSYLNILMGYCSTVGKTKVSDTAGARVVSISENGKKMTSYMSYLK